jgi:hypothetical protein
MHKRQQSKATHRSATGTTTTTTTTKRTPNLKTAKRKIKTKVKKTKANLRKANLRTTNTASFSTEQTQTETTNDAPALTIEQRKTWYHNKMRQIVNQTMQHLAAQFQLIPTEPVPAADAMFNALLSHELLVPIDAPQHPYKLSNNKKELVLDMIEKAFIPLGIVPQTFRTKYRIGTIPPIEFCGKTKTDTTDLSPLAGLSDDEKQSLTQVTTVADMIAMVLASSGYKDIPETDEEWANTALPPKGEDHTTDFSHNKVKLFHPDVTSEFQANTHKYIRGELAAIQADLADAQSLDIFDTYSGQYRRKDITQLFLLHYAGGQFPNIEVYKSFLIQQAAQTILHEQYMYNGFSRDDNSPTQAPLSTNGRPVQIHYHTVAGSMDDFKEQWEQADQLRKKQDMTVFDNVGKSMPDDSYPRIHSSLQGVLPQPPPEFIAQMGTPAHVIKEAELDKEGAYLNREAFKPLLYSQPIAGIRELFLQHFRHDITTYHNFMQNDLLHKFKTIPMHDDFNQEEIGQLRNIVETMYAQNQLDAAFKEVYTTGQLQKIQRQLVDKKDEVGEAEKKADEAVYQHVLAQKYPVFAQKSYSILKTECDQHIATTKDNLMKRIEAEDKGEEVVVM